jgi:hypothetical protein
MVPNELIHGQSKQRQHCPTNIRLSSPSQGNNQGDAKKIQEHQSRNGQHLQGKQCLVLLVAGLIRTLV